MMTYIVQNYNRKKNPLILPTHKQDSSFLVSCKHYKVDVLNDMNNYQQDGCQLFLDTHACHIYRLPDNHT